MSSYQLPRATPESVGVSSSDLLAFVDSVEEHAPGLHSLMVLRHGSVIAEGWWKPYQRENVHLLYSLSKSFTSTAIGFAVREGLLDLDDSVISFFPEETPAEPSEKLKSMKVRHLLSMSCGHAKDDMSEMYARDDGNWVRGFLAREVEFEPGTHFLYNSSASYVLSAIVQHVTGETTLDYLRLRLLDPIGIGEATWESSPQGINMGGWGMSVTTDAIARFGQLYLQKGVWNGHQIIPEEWVADATRIHVSNGSNPESDWEQGYGFQFWRCRHNCYRGDGAFGQFCIVVPEKDMVVAITAAVASMQDVLNLVWNHIVEPAQSEPHPTNYGAHLSMLQKLGDLALAGPEGVYESPVVRSVSGRTFDRIEEGKGIQSCRFDFTSEGCEVTLFNNQKEFIFKAGFSEWIHGVSSLELPDQSIAARAAWVSDDEFEIKILDVKSPSGTTIRSHFDGDTVEVKITLQYRFGPPDGPTFKGKAR
jgi:CubicO group peptidase (beta-lactamase class C family)